MVAERVSLSREDFPNCVSKSWQKLLKDEKFVDCTLVCENSKQVKVHKVILSSSSKFFCDILTENPHPHPLIYLKGVNQDKLLKIIEFIYAGETLISEQEVNDFVGLGKDLQVEGLVDEHIQSRAAMRSKRGLSVHKPVNEASREKPDHGVLDIPDDNEFVDDKDAPKINDDETADNPDLGVEEISKKGKCSGKGKGKVTVGKRSSPRKKRKIKYDETADAPDLGVEEISKKGKCRGKGKSKVIVGKRSSPRKKRNWGKCPMCDLEFNMLLLEYHAFNCKG